MAYINGRRVVGMMRSAGGGESSTLLTTTTDATLVSGTTYELALTYLTETPKINDFIVYVNNGALTTLYQVTAVDSTNATLEKIGDIGGGGKQLYQYNVMTTNLTFNYSDSQYSGRLVFSFIDETPSFANINDLVSYLYNHPKVVQYGVVLASPFNNVPFQIRKITQGTSSRPLKIIGVLINSGNWSDVEINASIGNSAIYHIDSREL